MKNNVYQFPVGAQKSAFKDAVSARKCQVNRAKVFSKSGAALRSVLDWTFFITRLALATGLHIVVCLPFAALLALRKPVFWIGGIICVVTYYHLDHQFFTDRNYTIPFFVGLWILSFISVPVLTWLNTHMPFHRLLALESSDNKRDDELQS